MSNFLVSTRIVASCLIGAVFFSMLPRLASSKDPRLAPVASEVITLISDHHINALDFSPDGVNLVAASYSYSGAAQVWEWRQKNLLPIVFANTKNVNILAADAVKYSPGGNMVTWCGLTAAVWEARSANLVLKSKYDPSVDVCRGTAFAPSGREFFSGLNSYGARTSRITARDTASWNVIWSLQSHEFFIDYMSLSPGGAMIALAGNRYAQDATYHEVRIVDVQSRTLVHTFEPVPPRQRGDIKSGPSISRLAWHPDGVQLAVGLRGLPIDGAPAVKIYDATSGKLIHEEHGTLGGYVSGLCYSPDGRYLIELGVGKGVRIWDGGHNHLLQEIAAKPSSCAVSKDSRNFALGGSAPGLGVLHPLLNLISPSNGKVIVYEFK